MKKSKSIHEAEKKEIKEKILTPKIFAQIFINPSFTFNFIVIFIFVSNDNDINEFNILSKVTWGGGGLSEK